VGLDYKNIHKYTKIRQKNTKNTKIQATVVENQLKQKEQMSFLISLFVLKLSDMTWPSAGGQSADYHALPVRIVENAGLVTIYPPKHCLQGTLSSLTAEFKDFSRTFSRTFQGPSYDNHAHSKRYSTSTTLLVYMQSFYICNRIITHTLTQ